MGALFLVVAVEFDQSGCYLGVAGSDIRWGFWVLKCWVFPRFSGVCFLKLELDHEYGFFAYLKQILDCPESYNLFFININNSFRHFKTIWSEYPSEKPQSISLLIVITFCKVNIVPPANVVASACVGFTKLPVLKQNGIVSKLFLICLEQVFPLSWKSIILLLPTIVGLTDAMILLWLQEEQLA